MDRILLYNSNASASLSRDFAKNTFAFKAHAEDFDMSDLNSSLFSKLFNGKISFDGSYRGWRILFGFLLAVVFVVFY